MSGLPITPSLNPVANCFYYVQQRVYTAHQAARAFCSTDNKIYAFLVLGRVLQAAACFFFVVALVSMCVPGPITPLCSLVRSVALGALGTWCAGDMQKVDSPVMQVLNRGMGVPFVSPSRAVAPFVAGQPIGLNNSGNNCWLNASLQMLANIPTYQQCLRQTHPPLLEFLDAYDAARSGPSTVASAINIQQMRQVMCQISEGRLEAGYTQEDPVAVFSSLFASGPLLYAFEQTQNGFTKPPREEPMVAIEIDKDAPIPTFEVLLKGFFDLPEVEGAGGRGRIRQHFFFPKAPNDLLICFKRLYAVPVPLPEGAPSDAARPRALKYKITADIETPERFQFPKDFLRQQEEVTYQCDAFLSHLGPHAIGGHYVAYIKQGSTWWCCNDARVDPVSTEAALAAIKQSYIIHYAKVQ